MPGGFGERANGQSMIVPEEGVAPRTLAVKSRVGPSVAVRSKKKKKKKHAEIYRAPSI